MKNFIFIFILSFSATFSVFSQSAEKLSDVLASEKVTLGQLSYLAGTCGLGLPDETDYSTAFEKIKEQNLLPKSVIKDASEGDVATISQAAYLFMKSTNLSGGVMYKLTNAKRYAFKEVKARGILPPNADPNSTLDGHDAFAILNGCLSQSK